MRYRKNEKREGGKEKERGENLTLYPLLLGFEIIFSWDLFHVLTNSYKA